MVCAPPSAAQLTLVTVSLCRSTFSELDAATRWTSQWSLCWQRVKNKMVHWSASDDDDDDALCDKIVKPFFTYVLKDCAPLDPAANDQSKVGVLYRHLCMLVRLRQRVRADPSRMREFLATTERRLQTRMDGKPLRDTISRMLHNVIDDQSIVESLVNLWVCTSTSDGTLKLHNCFAPVLQLWKASCAPGEHPTSVSSIETEPKHLQLWHCCSASMHGVSDAVLYLLTGHGQHTDLPDCEGDM